MFKVQSKQCDTCIFKKDSPHDLRSLLNQIRDPAMSGFFSSWRVCHHSRDACCRGFWDAHKDDFAVGQVAQRLNVVRFVDEDVLK